MSNPLLYLRFERALKNLGPVYWDVVEAASFPHTLLRFRKDPLLRQLGADPVAVSDAHIEQAFSRFEVRDPLLALRNQGHQFGT